MRRLLLAHLLGLALFLGLLEQAVIMAPAYAGDPRADHHSCVASREANSLHERLGRTVLEDRWEVAGEGVPVYVAGTRVIAYPWCEHPGMNEAWIGVIYNNRTATTVVWKLPEEIA